MPATCEECGAEKGYDDVVNFTCNFGYEHTICKGCLAVIKRKANCKVGEGD